jgi:predicted ribonuclease toxin of YeeF-YezG toxin-antitoxin module
MAETSATTTNRSQTRRKAAATDRSTAAKKAAATRARNQATEARKRSTAAKQAAETRRELQRTPVARYVDFAGRAVTIPVGAALVARDNVERELRARQQRIETDLRTFERRGTTARNRFERELGKRVERVERDLRTARRDAGARAGLVSSRVENLVQSGITVGTQVAAKAVERVARVA